MSNTSQPRKIDLQEVSTRNRIAREVISGFASASPTMTEIWNYLQTALADTPALAHEITLLHDHLTTARLNRANLAAAAQATIAAHLDGESDPLSYVRDELHAQGYADRGPT